MPWRLRVTGIAASALASVLLLSCSAELTSLGDELGGGGAFAGSPDGGFAVGSPVDGGANLRDAGSTLVDSGVPPGPMPPIAACDGRALASTDTRVRYFEEVVVPPASCVSESQVRTCTASGWSVFGGQFTATSCRVDGYDSCDGIAHGGTASRIRYAVSSAESSTACGSASETQTRLCNDGVWGAWSGVFTVDACSVLLGGACDFSQPFACAEGACDVFQNRCVRAFGSCSANLQCFDTCIAGACTLTSDIGGSCDDAADCKGCSSGSKCANGVCLCLAGSTCKTNAQCADTCVAKVCQAPGSACDAQDTGDCSSGYVCAPSGNSWTCRLGGGQACTSDSACAGSCIGGICAAIGGVATSCDSNPDCVSGYACSAGHTCLLATNQACTVGTACASGVCSVVRSLCE